MEERRPKGPYDKSAFSQDQCEINNLRQALDSLEFQMASTESASGPSETSTGPLTGIAISSYISSIVNSPNQNSKRIPHFSPNHIISPSVCNSQPKSFRCNDEIPEIRMLREKLATHRKAALVEKQEMNTKLENAIRELRERDTERADLEQQIGVKDQEIRMLRCQLEGKHGSSISTESLDHLKWENECLLQKAETHRRELDICNLVLNKATTTLQAYNKQLKPTFNSLGMMHCIASPKTNDSVIYAFSKMDISSVSRKNMEAMIDEIDELVNHIPAFLKTVNRDNGQIQSLKEENMKLKTESLQYRATRQKSKSLMDKVLNETNAQSEVISTKLSNMKHRVKVMEDFISQNTNLYPSRLSNDCLKQSLSDLDLRSKIIDEMEDTISSKWQHRVNQLECTIQELRNKQNEQTKENGVTDVHSIPLISTNRKTMSLSDEKYIAMNKFVNYMLGHRVDTEVPVETLKEEMNIARRSMKNLFKKSNPSAPRHYPGLQIHAKVLCHKICSDRGLNDHENISNDLKRKGTDSMDRCVGNIFSSKNGDHQKNKNVSQHNAESESDSMMRRFILYVLNGTDHDIECEEINESELNSFMVKTYKTLQSLGVSSIPDALQTAICLQQKTFCLDQNIHSLESKLTDTAEKSRKMSSHQTHLVAQYQETQKKLVANLDSTNQQWRESQQRMNLLYRFIKQLIDLPVMTSNLQHQQNSLIESMDSDRLKCTLAEIQSVLFEATQQIDDHQDLQHTICQLQQQITNFKTDKINLRRDLRNAQDKLLNAMTNHEGSEMQQKLKDFDSFIWDLCTQNPICIEFECPQQDRHISIMDRFSMQMRLRALKEEIHCKFGKVRHQRNVSGEAAEEALVARLQWADDEIEKMQCKMADMDDELKTLHCVIEGKDVKLEEFERMKQRFCCMEQKLEEEIKCLHGVIAEKECEICNLQQMVKCLQDTVAELESELEALRNPQCKRAICGTQTADGLWTGWDHPKREGPACAEIQNICVPDQCEDVDVNDLKWWKEKLEYHYLCEKGSKLTNEEWERAVSQLGQYLNQMFCIHSVWYMEPRTIDFRMKHDIDRIGAILSINYLLDRMLQEMKRSERLRVDANRLRCDVKHLEQQQEEIDYRNRQKIAELEDQGDYWKTKYRDQLKGEDKFKEKIKELRMEVSKQKQNAKRLERKVGRARLASMEDLKLHPEAAYLAAFSD